MNKSTYEAVRSLDRWNTANFVYCNSNEFAATRKIEKGIHSIHQDDMLIDLYADIKADLPLVIFFHGAVKRAPSFKLPVFLGFGVVDGLELSYVSISDPTLHVASDLQLAWYAGSHSSKTQTVLPGIINTIITKARAKKVIFIGASGGGFASLYYSRLVKGSLAVAINPQTDIFKYEKTAVMKYINTAFGVTDLESGQMLVQNIIETNVGALYSIKRSNSVLYLQNESDDHVQKHCEPFFKNLGHELAPINTRRVEPGLYLYLADWGTGHIGPPPAFYKSLVKSLIATKKSWKTILSKKYMDQIFSTATEASKPQQQARKSHTLPTSAEKHTHPQPVSYQVTLTPNASNLIANVIDASPDDQFAFYIFKDGKRVHEQWYSQKSECIFRIDNPEGKYQATGFVKDIHGKISFGRSEIVDVTTAIQAST